MKKTILFIGLLFFISCSNNDSNNIEPISPSNKLVSSYMGYYEVYFDLPTSTSTFDNIKVTPIIEQISTTEEYNLLQIFANTNNDNDNYITFKVLAEGTGNDILYDNSFVFKSHGATYHPTNLDFIVMTNNGSEFSAQFSGELEHWHNGEQRYVYLNINSGSIVTNY